MSSGSYPAWAYIERNLSTPWSTKYSLSATVMLYIGYTINCFENASSIASRKVREQPGHYYTEDSAPCEHPKHEAKVYCKHIHEEHPLKIHWMLCLSTTYPRATIQTVGGMGRESTIAVSTSTSITPVGLEPKG